MKKTFFLFSCHSKVLFYFLFCGCKTCFLFPVFSMGNNAYGQCGRPIVEDEVYRFVLNVSPISITGMNVPNFIESSVGV